MQRAGHFAPPSPSDAEGEILPTNMHARWWHMVWRMHDCFHGDQGPGPVCPSGRALMSSSPFPPDRDRDGQQGGGRHHSRHSEQASEEGGHSGSSSMSYGLCRATSGAAFAAGHIPPCIPHPDLANPDSHYLLLHSLPLLGSLTTASLARREASVGGEASRMANKGEA